MLRETKEVTGVDIRKNECTFLFNDPAFNCDVYLTKKEASGLYGEAIVYRQPVNILIDLGAIECIISKDF
ncbi:hypothetical protein RhiirA5_431441 [Rhizophagus irregularis]|uniref:Uncharacterized protein n=1 Tax=Rhizophagus irregularis TaxID=588596 RepID=A0A2N0NV14_9GLOM|nr:hypothetical protein RhiirA5_431441 [Rhizophagus irregularis]